MAGGADNVISESHKTGEKMAQNNGTITRILFGLIIALILGAYAYSFALDLTSAKAITAVSRQCYQVQDATNQQYVKIAERLTRIETILERIANNR